MGQYPPSPSVEDEVTALANEHPTNGVLQVPKSDNQGALSRGPVDQYPILIHAADVERLGRTVPSSQDQTDKRYSNESLATDVSSSEDSAGPPTPPPASRREQRKSRGQSGHRGPSATASATVDNSSIADHISSARVRPRITRIQTDVGRDNHSAMPGDRRQPSPYAISRATTFHNMDAGYTAASENFLSPSYNVASPKSPRMHQGDSAGSSARNNDQPWTPQISRTPYSEQRTPTNGPARSSTDAGDDRYTRRDVPVIRYGTQTQPQGRSPHPSVADDRRRPYYEVPNRANVASSQISPSNSRRPSNVSTYGSSGEDLTNQYRATGSRRSSIHAKDSTYSSSTDEASQNYKGRSGKNSGDEMKKSRRRSSHRTERPVLVDTGRNSRPGSQSTSAVDGGEARHYRYDPRYPTQYNELTPFSSDPHQNEGFFEQAFRANDDKWFSNKQGPRSSGSVLVSPLTSPPRTPRSEMLGRDYFDSGAATQKPPQRSRPPSMDEAKNPSLLSVATAGAAMAARASASSSRASPPSNESNMHTARSRGPSTVREEHNMSLKTMTSGSVGQPQPVRSPTTPNVDSRPISRGSTTSNDTGNGYTQTGLHPHRAMSHSGLEHSQAWNGFYPPAAVTPTNPALSQRLNTFTPQSRSARTSISGNDPVLPISSRITFPPCPRPGPVAGYRDWYTTKETSDIDICPTCVSVIASTRYRDRLIPSLLRPYNEPSVCAMSKPWARVAFLQAVRRNRADLSSMRMVINAHKETRPCAGDKSDIRRWFHVIDPRTKEPVPDFFACTACVCAVDNIFPDICEVFERPKYSLNQERVCTLHTGHKHFQSIIDYFEQTEYKLRGHKWRSADIEPLVRHLNRVARYRPCPRDKMLSSRLWHSDPNFPEFTICEECYDEVVWPVHEKRVARDISRTVKPGPAVTSLDGSPYGVSCQLYSDRMRNIFKDAVASRDIKTLHDTVLKRVNVQRSMADTEKQFEHQIKLGVDRHKDLEENRKAWLKFERGEYLDDMK